jgi:hypothetical protein
VAAEFPEDKFNFEDNLISPQNEMEPLYPSDDFELMMERQNTRSSIVRLPSKLQKSRSDPSSHSKSSKQVIEDF